ncbi:MAG: thermosome subunit alpha [Candidatus Woesearchaeota archaeon]
MQKDYTPFVVIPEKEKKSAQKRNIEVAKEVAESVRTTLGPKGMDKLLVNGQNKITVTNDGVTILQEMEYIHPIAQMIIQIAQTQESEVGDGTTTAVILAGELLSKAQDLLQRGIHPTIINKGYKQASEKALAIIESLATKVDATDTEILTQIITTAMTGKGAESIKEDLTSIIIEAVSKVSQNKHAKPQDIKIEKRVGSNKASTLIKGILIDKGRVHPDMPNAITDAKIALLNCALEVKDTETKSNISITNPEQIKQFIEQEDLIVKHFADTIIASGANVVFCQKGIDDLVQYQLAKKGIFAVRRVTQTDMEKFARATGAKIIFDINDLVPETLGQAEEVYESRERDTVTYVTGCKNDIAATIVISGGTEHVADEICRAVDDALGDVFAVLKNNTIVPGAGAIEIEIAKNLYTFAKTLSGREQLAIKAFAESLETIPKTLAENAGLDPIDITTTLYAEHEKGIADAGIDVFSGNAIKALEKGIVEPSAIKIHAIQSATEVATMILRIDDTIVSPPEQQAPQGYSNQYPGF